jgi:hypothetical protein
MSEIATEITGAVETVTTSEFLGKTFAERREALLKARAFAEMTQAALADSVEMMVGKIVEMKFRPKKTKVAQYPNVWVPCYSLMDEVREPITQTVHIHTIDPQNRSAHLVGWEISDDGVLMYTGQEWKVNLQNIFSMEEVPADYGDEPS